MRTGAACCGGRKPERQTTEWTAAVPQPMTDENSQSRARRGRRLGRHIASAVMVAWGVGIGLPASAQQETAQPLPPPEVVPPSRLTVTPSEFERWLTRRTESTEIVPQPEKPAPRIATPPPPPPLAAPPPPPVLAPPPRATAPTAVPRAPDMQPVRPPQPPETAILPPESPSTTVPPEPAARRVPRPDDVRIVYAPDATDVPTTAREKLDGLAEWLAANPSERVQIEAFASQTTSAGSEARRLSLLRAREVRRYLIGKGAAETQIGVRALGARTDETPKDRVEITLPSQ